MPEKKEPVHPPSRFSLAREFALGTMTELAIARAWCNGGRRCRAWRFTAATAYFTKQNAAFVSGF